MEYDVLSNVPDTREGISTHTLTWSTTSDRETGEMCMVDFNSHTHVEYDEYSIRLWEIIEHFNSHTHVEYDGRIRGCL